MRWWVAPLQSMTLLQWWWTQGWGAATCDVPHSPGHPQADLFSEEVVEAGSMPVAVLRPYAPLPDGGRALGPSGSPVSSHVFHTPVSSLEVARDVH